MKETVRYVLVLGLICLVAGSLLAGVDSLTRPRIIAQAEEAEESGLKEVVPQAVRFQPVKSGEDILYYKAYDKDNKLAAVAFKASAKGYSSNIETIAGMKQDGTITSIKILSQNETPGLGTRVTEPEFTGQFMGVGAGEPDKVQAITGATISSSAVIDSVIKKAQEIKALIKDQ